MGGRTAVGAHANERAQPQKQSSQKPASAANWRHRALELAERQEQKWVRGISNPVNWPRWVSQHSLSEPLGSHGVERFTVESASRADVTHELVYDAAADRVTCDCEAGLHGQLCWHAGMVARWLAYLASLMTPRAQAEARREQYLAWLDEGNEGGGGGD